MDIEKEEKQPKGKVNRKAITKMISLFPPQLEAIEHFIADKGMASASDVIRQALIFFHDKTYPAYVYNLSPAAKEKKKRLEAEAQREAQTPEQLASAVDAQIFAHSDGRQFVLFRGWGNSVWSTPLEQLKESLEKFPDIIDQHQGLSHAQIPEFPTDEDLLKNPIKV